MAYGFFAAFVKIHEPNAPGKTNMIKGHRATIFLCILVGISWSLLALGLCWSAELYLGVILVAAAIFCFAIVLGLIHCLQHSIKWLRRGIKQLWRTIAPSRSSSSKKVEVQRLQD